MQKLSISMETWKACLFIPRGAQYVNKKIEFFIVFFLYLVITYFFS